MNVENGTNL